MKQIKTKRPSCFSTWCEILKFYLLGIAIPKEHHPNLANLHGCTKKQFATYVTMYPLSDEAVTLLLNAKNDEMLKLFMENTAFDFKDDVEATLLQRYGMEKLVQTGRLLSEETELLLIASRKYPLIEEYINKHFLSYRAEEALFETDNTDLLSDYINANELCPETQQFLIINGKEDVLRLYIEHYALDNKVVTEFYKNAPAELLGVYLKNWPSYPDDTEFEILLRRNEPKIIKALLRTFDSLDSDHLALLLQQKDERLWQAFVEAYVEKKKTLPDKVWERLFATEELRDLFKCALAALALPEHLEIRLLSLQDKDLPDCYLQHNSLKNFSFSLLLALEDRRLLTEYLKSHLLTWREECQLIDTKDSAALDCYLANHALSTYAFGYRLKKASPAEAADLLKEVEVFDAMVISALMHHNETDFWKIYLQDCEYDFNEDFVVEFAYRAASDIVTDYLSHWLEHDRLAFCFSNEYPIYEALLKRNDRSITEFLLQHGNFDEDTEALFIQLAPTDIVKKYLTEFAGTLSDDAEIALIQRKECDLIEIYLDKHLLYSDVEFKLLTLLEPELLADYLNNHSGLAGKYMDYLTH